MLGAAEHRCAGKLPYDKTQDGEGRWFRMAEPVAQEVLRMVADEESAAATD